MKRFYKRIICGLLIANLVMVMICSCHSQEKAAFALERPNLKTIVDYTDWYRDDKKTNMYNYVQWIELDVWFKEVINEYDWTDVTYDVSYEGQVLITGLAVDVGVNYFECYFDVNSVETFPTYNGYLAPGSYEMVLRDGEGKTIASSVCEVTAHSGDVLSQMIVNTERIEDAEAPIALQICFDGDISSYSKTGFYITISLDEGETAFVPELYSVELAESYLIVRCYDTRFGAQDVVLSIFCGDGTLVCSEILIV